MHALLVGSRDRWVYSRAFGHRGAGTLNSLTFIRPEYVRPFPHHMGMQTDIRPSGPALRIPFGGAGLGWVGQGGRP